MAEHEHDITKVEIPTESPNIIQEDGAQCPVASTPSIIEPSPDPSTSSEASPAQIRTALEYRLWVWIGREWTLHKILEETTTFFDRLMPLTREEMERAGAFLRGLSEDRRLAYADVYSALVAARSKDSNVEELSCQVSRVEQRVAGVASELRKAWDCLCYLSGFTPTAWKRKNVIKKFHSWGVGSGCAEGRPAWPIWEECSTDPDIHVASKSSPENACKNDVAIDKSS